MQLQSCIRVRGAVGGGLGHVAGRNAIMCSCAQCCRCWSLCCRLLWTCATPSSLTGPQPRQPTLPRHERCSAGILQGLSHPRGCVLRVSRFLVCAQRCIEQAACRTSSQERHRECLHVFCANRLSQTLTSVSHCRESAKFRCMNKKVKCQHVPSDSSVNRFFVSGHR